MIRTTNQHQLNLAGFESPFQTAPIQTTDGLC